jgi:hypothetical protein
MPFPAIILNTEWRAVLERLTAVFRQESDVQYLDATLRL